jgi:hypothetical protein
MTEPLGGRADRILLSVRTACPHQGGGGVPFSPFRGASMISRIFNPLLMLSMGIGHSETVGR